MHTLRPSFLHILEPGFWQAKFSLQHTGGPWTFQSIRGYCTSWIWGFECFATCRFESFLWKKVYSQCNPQLSSWTGYLGPASPMCKPLTATHSSRSWTHHIWRLKMQIMHIPFSLCFNPEFQPFQAPHPWKVFVAFLTTTRDSVTKFRASQKHHFPCCLVSPSLMTF